MKSLRNFSGSLILIAVIVVLVLFWSPALSALKDLRGLVLSFFDRGFDYEAFKALQLENQNLKLELEKLNKPKQEFAYNYREAEVYSRYPFSDEESFIVNLGSQNGLKVGAPVLVGKNILLGKIKAVKKTVSEVQLVESPSWRSSVAIGGDKVKAVLTGGSLPRLELIAPESLIRGDDEVVNISPEFPYGLYLGTVDRIEYSSTTPWLKATLKIPYRLEDLKKVLVIVDYDGI